jgi:hypothetical protein
MQRLWDIADLDHQAHVESIGTVFACKIEIRRRACQKVNDLNGTKGDHARFRASPTRGSGLMRAAISKYRPLKARTNVNGMFVWVDHPPRRNVVNRLVKRLSDIVYQRRLMRLRREIEARQFAERQRA